MKVNHPQRVFIRHYRQDGSASAPSAIAISTHRIIEMRPLQLLLVLLLLGAGSAQAQHRVSGRVLDGDSGATLPGANIVVKGTVIGAVSAADGTYTLDVPSPNDTLQVSFVGFVMQEIPIRGRSVVDVTLQPDTQMLETVVIVGYAAQRERDVSGSITTIDASKLQPVARTSVNQMLQGQAPGLNMQTRSAQPGGGVSVNIRGDISPRGSGTPLYVIDGVPVTEYRSSVPGLATADLGFYGGVDRDPLAYLNPSDIETITILKDASAAAIYGSAAANGVVLITTKSGRSGDIQVSYRGSYTAQTPHEYFPLLNATQFMQEQDRMAYERYLFESGLAPYGDRDPSTVGDYVPLFTEADMAAAGEGTDWLDLVTEDGWMQEHNISLSGGSGNTVAYASFNYQHNDAVLRGSDLDRYSARINLDQTISDRARLRLRLNGSRLEGNNASTGSNSGGVEKYNMLQAAYAYSPTVPVYEEDGTYTYTFNRLIMNPAAFLSITDDSRTTNLFAAPTLELDLVSNLKATVVGQFQQETTQRGFYLPRTTNNAQAPEGMAQKAEYTVQNRAGEAYLTYTREFGESNLSVVGGAGYYKAETDGTTIQGVGFFTDAFTYNNIGVSSEKLMNDIQSFRSARTKISQFARADYSYRDRYVLSLVARRDGSSIFAADHKYGIFPGISGAWILTEEDFMRNVPAITQLKVRLGYGQAGNETVLSGNTLQLYSPGYPFLIGTTFYNGVALSQIANPNLTWETVSTFNAGIDFGVWSNRIRGSIDLFQKTASDLLDYNQLPSNNAVGRVADNIGSTRSRGFEVALHTINPLGNALRWTSDLNVSYSKANWVERNPEVALASYIDSLGAMDTIYGWETMGIIQTEGDKPEYMVDAQLGNVAYVDQNGDGVLDEYDVVILGNSTPRWRIGFNNTFSYRGFDLNVFVYGSFGYRRGNTYAPSAFNISQSTNPENTTIYAQDIWSSQNTTGTFPGIATNPYNVNNPSGTDFNLKNASFLRLRNISLGYTLPSSLFRSIGTVRRARVFVNLEDLGVITNYPGFDPEYTEANPYPKSYSTTIGIELDF